MYLSSLFIILLFRRGRVARGRGGRKGTKREDEWGGSPFFFRDAPDHITLFWGGGGGRGGA
jgi:hypothetical protein